jgi:hypothetical protein
LPSDPGPSEAGMGNIDSPFTRSILSNLDEEDHKMVAMALASHIQTDCDARNLDFGDLFHLLGHKTKGNALRTLTTTISETEIVIITGD